MVDQISVHDLKKKMDAGEKFVLVDVRELSELAVASIPRPEVVAIPLGELYEDLGENVFVPLGWGLSPPIPPDVLRQLARAPTDVRLFARITRSISAASSARFAGSSASNALRIGP